MRRVTVLLLAGVFVLVGNSFSQATDFTWLNELSTDLAAPYSLNHSGSRQVSGPYDLDGDGLIEVLVQDYTGGGRVHVLEVVGPDTWEHVYSTPVLDEYPGTNNARTIAGGDVDGDGKGEIYFFAGRSYAENSPYPPGLYVFEHTGIDNDYGDAPASIYEFVDLPNRWRQEQLTIVDVDKDGSDELLFGNNGNNTFDRWYVLGVEGDIGSGFETWIEEAVWTSRSIAPDFIDRGGGSPYGMVAADLDGNGQNEIVMTSWNCLNTTIARVLAPNAYLAAGAGTPNAFRRLTLDPGAGCGAPDHVSFFGLNVVDVDGDGNDEVYGSVLQTGNVYIINYNPGEDVSGITDDNFTLDLIPGLSSLGLTIGDLDGDGHMDFIGTGSTYEAEEFNNNEPPNWIDIVEYNGGDPENPASYSDVINVLFPEDQLDSFDLVVRDSAGVITEFRESGDQGGEFVSKLAFLGDPDNDGFTEVALGFQGIDDSTFVFNETFNPLDSTYTRVLVSATANPRRAFMRVLASDGTNISIQDDRVVLPSDYILEQNYPNPFNPSTTIRFTLPLDKTISVKVYDITGRLVKSIVDHQFYAQGVYEVVWDGTNLAGIPAASGSYLYTLQYGNFRQTKRMVLLK